MAITLEQLVIWLGGSVITVLGFTLHRLVSNFDAQIKELFRQTERCKEERYALATRISILEDRLKAHFQ